MKGYKGNIAFLKNAGSDYLYTHLCHRASAEEYFSGFGNDKIILGEVFVDIEFKDTRQQEVEAIDEQIKQTRAELEARINALLGKKQELLALEGS